MISIRNKKDCCGCTACYSICPKHCISMQEDEEGFLYPKVDISKCVNCNLCESVCPLINYKANDINTNIYAVKNKNLDVVSKSASGGMFSVLSDYVILREGVVCGVVYDDHFEVLHDLAYTKAESERFRSSKYVQSDLRNIFVKIKDILSSGKYVLFSGTPCQVAGLKSFLWKGYDNLLTCDIICHSVSSPKIFQNFMCYAQHKKKIKGINMRWKGYGWNRSTMRIDYDDGSYIAGKSYAKLWYDITFSGLVSRPSCYDCKFCNFNRQGDITIGDFWGVEKVYPDFYDKNGVSLVMVNTLKGEKVFQKIQDKINFIPSNKECCIQPRLKTPARINPKRDKFWNDYYNQSFGNVVNKYWHFSIVSKILFFVERGIKFLLRKLKL